MHENEVESLHTNYVRPDTIYMYSRASYSLFVLPSFLHHSAPKFYKRSLLTYAQKCACFGAIRAQTHTRAPMSTLYCLASHKKVYDLLVIKILDPSVKYLINIILYEHTHTYVTYMYAYVL